MNIQTINQIDTSQQNQVALLKSRKKIYYALFGLLMRGTVQNLLDVCTLAVSGKSIDFLHTAINLSAILLFVYGLTELLSKTGIFVIGTTAFFALSWLASGVIYPQNVNYLKESSTQFFIYVLPFMWIGYYLIRRELYLDDFLNIARLKLLLAIITQIIIFIIPSADIFNNDYMDSSNAILVGLISVYYLMSSKKKMIDVVLSIAGTVIIIISGSRGVFLSLIFFWVMYIFFKKQRDKWITIILLVFMLLIFTLIGNKILNAIVDLSNSIGFSTHLIDAITDRTIFNDSNRTYLFRNFWNALKEKPILGYGILGDRYLSLRFSNHAIYPHNIVLEILVNFGYLLGIPMIISFTISTLKGLMSSNTKACDTVLILLCSCIVKLMVSSTFWNDQIFFILIGVLLALSFNKNILVRNI